MGLMSAEKRGKGSYSVNSLRSLVDDTSRALTELEQEMEQLIAQHSENWKEVERELNGTVMAVNENFQEAAKQAVADNMQEQKTRRKLYQMCERVDSLGHISTAVLTPYMDPEQSVPKRLNLALEAPEEAEARSPLERIFEIKVIDEDDPAKYDNSPKSTRKFLKSSGSMVFEEVQKIEEREEVLVEKMKEFEGRVSRSNSFSNMKRSGSFSSNLSRNASFGIPSFPSFEILRNSYSLDLFLLVRTHSLPQLFQQRGC